MDTGHWTLDTGHRTLDTGHWSNWVGSSMKHLHVCVIQHIKSKLNAEIRTNAVILQSSVRSIVNIKTSPRFIMLVFDSSPQLNG